MVVFMNANALLMGSHKEGGRVLGHKVDDLGTQLLDCLGLAGQTLEVGKLLLWSGSGLLGFEINGNLDGLVNVVCNLGELWLEETSGSHGRSTDSQSRWEQSRNVTRNGVLVGSDVGSLQNSLNSGTVDALGTQVNEDQVGVGSARNKVESLLLERVSKRGCIGYHIRLVLLVFWGGCLFKSNRESRDGVVVRTTLVGREHREVDLLLQLVWDLLTLLGDLSDTLSEEDHGTSWASKRLVGGGGDNVRIWEWRVGDTSSNQPGDVGHIRHQVGSDLVGDLLHSGVIHGSGVGRGTSHNDLWSEQHGGLFQSVVVDQTGLLVQSIWHGLEVLGDVRNLGGWGLVTVRQMASMRQVQTHQSVTNLQDGGVGVKVGWGTRQRLDVDSPLGRVQTKRLERSLLTQALGHVDELVTTVVSLAWDVAAQLRTQRREQCASSRRGPMADFVLKQEERRAMRLLERQAQQAERLAMNDLDRFLEQHESERDYDADEEENTQEDRPDGLARTVSAERALEYELEQMLALEQAELEELTRTLNLRDDDDTTQNHAAAQ
ncbi:hypothetical protein OGAPHI_003119 [Ogataea philodendri]|uniref:Uncharacterized protein n=1 Tax=Ogataea philodendri TaxID=1378263 RepID=A0A9P8P930_9ASCO|nr:uncharacterized protein OGAPHI_003119 [Ogataea philodendri]KAH3667470.1 hypothetical protein OGAPHI_003119 [Ogataea philodendri]